ncbi:MAG: hypothetical protein AABW53_00625 [Nanoarchaeota archaeon]
MTQIPLDLEQTAASYNKIAISFKPNQEAQLEAELLRSIGFSAWFDKYRRKPVETVDAASDKAVGQELNQGWFAYRPLRIINIRY